MSQQFSKTDDPWSRLDQFRHNGVLVTPQPYAHRDHSAATTVFTASNSSEVFHADKHCHRLHTTDTFHMDGEERRSIKALTLEQVLTEYSDPVRPCDYCTQDIYRTVEIAKEIDGVPESVMHYYEPGDSKVTTTYSRNDDGEMEVVQEHASEVYPDGGTDLGGATDDE